MDLYTIEISQRYTCSITHRIHGAGIYANMTGVNLDGKMNGIHGTPLI